MVEDLKIKLRIQNEQRKLFQSCSLKTKAPVVSSLVQWSLENLPDSSVPAAVTWRRHAPQKVKKWVGQTPPWRFEIQRLDPSELPQWRKLAHAIADEGAGWHDVSKGLWEHILAASCMGPVDEYHQDLYAWAIRSFYCKKEKRRPEDEQRVFTWLLDHPNCSISRDSIMQSMVFSVTTLQGGCRHVCLQPALPSLKTPLTDPDTKHYLPLNPSCLGASDGQSYLVLIRAVNYRQEKLVYTYLEAGEEVIRTRNLLTRVDENGTILHQAELINVPDDYFYKQIQGLEDIQLFRHEGQVRFLATIVHVGYMHKMCIGTIFPNPDLHPNADSYRIVNFALLKRPDFETSHKNAEKNWLPFVHDNCFSLWIYGYSTDNVEFLFANPDGTTIPLRTEKCFSLVSLRGCKGSAAPLPFPGGWLLLVHVSADWHGAQERNRVYMHRFLFMDKDRMITRWSPLFVFEHNGVEFARSLCWSQDGRDVIIGLGVEDRVAKLVFVPAKYVSTELLSPARIVRPLPGESVNMNLALPD